MPALKYSRQREAVKNLLMSRRDHPTADMLYSSLRKEYPNISLGTIYRNLSLLSDLGEINRISAGNGAEHFDGDLTPHQHFICSRCQRIYDVRLERIDSLLREAGDASPGRVDACRVTFYGICENCLREKEKDQEIVP